MEIQGWEYKVERITKKVREMVEQEFQLRRCKYCGSAHVVRYGHSKYRQRLLCRDCKHTFMDSDTLPGMKVSPQVTAAAVGMFYEGMSLNAIRRQLHQQYAIYPSDSTVYDWIQRYTKSAVNTADTHKPQVGEVWVADETVIKVNGKNTWFWDIIDAKTRFLLASRISQTRGTRDARALVEDAARRAGKTPKMIVTDQLAGYIDGIELAFGSDTKHIQAKTLTSEPAKELIERFHGSLKDRTKVMRGLKSKESADEILNGWVCWYNFMRPHESLNNETPAHVAGIKFEYKNWLDIVKSPTSKIDTMQLKPSLELHHPPVSKSATATLGHFAGHKVRISPRMPHVSPRMPRISREVNLGAGVVRSRGRQHIRLT
jgi:transposase-like protein